MALQFTYLHLLHFLFLLLMKLQPSCYPCALLLIHQVHILRVHATWTPKWLANPAESDDATISGNVKNRENVAFLDSTFLDLHLK